MSSEYDASAVQPAVRRLLAIGKPFADSLSQAEVDEIVSASDALTMPISSDDALAILSCLPAKGDLLYEVNWTLLHAIEACEAWPIWPALHQQKHEWIDILKLRLANAGLAEPT